MNARIGILGGTFDPVHFGHLFIAEFLRKKLALDRVLFIPCGTPPHKRTPLAPGTQRCAMITRALRGNRHFALSRIETDRAGVSYSIDTVQQLTRQYGPGADFFFLIGADNIAEIPSWKKYRQLLDECRVIAIARPGYVLKAIPKIPARKITLIHAPSPDISSTLIRKMAARRHSIRYLVPDAVWNYIEKNSMYIA